MAEEFTEATRTKLPTELDEEQPFLSLAEIKLSLRQMLTILMAGAAWFTMMQITTWIVPISGGFAALLWSWIAIVGLVFALVKKDGVPYEEYLTRRVVFLMSDRHYIATDEDTKSFEDTDWDEFEDPFSTRGSGDRF